MKKYYKLSLIVAMFALLPFFINAQSPPHPNGGNNPGAGNGPVGGSAGIESGLTILMAMSAAYGMRKLYHMFRTTIE